MIFQISRFSRSNSRYRGYRGQFPDIAIATAKFPISRSRRPNSRFRGIATTANYPCACHIGSRTFVTLHGQVGLNEDNNLVTERVFSEASRLRDFEVSSTWDEVGVLGDGHEGLNVGDKVRI